MPPIAVAIAVVEHAGQVLIGRRAEGVPLARLWEFPGGKIAPGETPAAAAARECCEETGLAVHVGPLLAQVEHPYAHGRLLLHFFSAVPADPAAAPREPFRWVPLSVLGDYAFPPANAEIVAQLLRKAGS